MSDREREWMKKMNESGRMGECMSRFGECINERESKRKSECVK